MANYNRIELTKIVSAGHLNDQGLPTENWEFNGLGGYTFRYYTNTGLVDRIDTDGNTFVFGLKSSSRHKTGYLCVEMVLPYNPIEHQFISPENLIFDKSGALVGVQYTCYVHQIASIVADCLGLNGNTRGSIANHKDGCPLHNWLSNIETVPPLLNTWHGAVVNSIKHNKSYFKKLVDNNAVKSFFYTNEISAYDVEAWMKQRPEFEAEVKTCAASLRDKETENVYISTYELWGLYDFLRINNKL